MNSSRHPEAWAEAQALVTLGADPWRIKDACEGTLIFGATGAGKTTGSGSALARSFLASGFGGLVLCAKPDEPRLWSDYAAQTGREADLRLFGGPEKWSFNFMRHESQRNGAGAGLTENIVTLFMEIASLGSGEARARGGDPFWDRSMRSLIRNCVDLITMSGDAVSLHAMFDVVRTAPADPSVISSFEWRSRSSCWQRLELAKERAGGSGWEADCTEVAGYWLSQIPSLGEKTRGSIFAMFSTLAEGLMRGKMRELFCGETTLAPEDVLEGKIVVVDLPVKEWSEVGRMAAVIWKYCVQKAVERRSDNGGGRGRPLFIWADECQHFTSRYDPLFQATARSSRAASVYLTQNYPSLAAALGGGAEGRALTDSLIGNMGTKIFHANSDRETNQLAAELVGRRIQSLRSSGAGSGFSLGAQASVSTSTNRGVSENVDFEIQPTEFSSLRKGGPENNFVSEALVLQNGRTWKASRRTWQKVMFKQELHAGAPAESRPRAPRLR